MKIRIAPVLAVALLSVTAAQGHFIYIIPADGKGKVVFSDELAPDANVDIAKIAATKLFSKQADGTGAPVEWTKGENAYEIKLPAAGVVGGACKYGVLQKGEGKPFLLVYHPKFVGGKLEASQPWKQLICEIVPLGNGQFQALYNGKPAAMAEFAAVAPGGNLKGQTDAEGKFKVETTAPGTYGLRVRHVETAAGDLDGKKYEEARHYATLVFQVGAAKAEAPKADVPENPEATKLLAEARAHRAEWTGFKGFQADLQVNIDGEISKGAVKVDAKGKVALEGLSKPAADFADKFLESLVAHRLPGTTERTTPVAFADDKDNPQGRLVRLLGDGLHSTYRIRDKQIMVVNRNMGGVKFTINVIENDVTKEGKYQPNSWTVTYWDVKTGAVKRSIVNHVTWKRLAGDFDLPTVCRVITTAPEGEGSGVSTASLTLSNYKLEK